MLELQNISLNIGSFSLNNICFKVSKGDYFVLLGSSGSGKTVLLETIAGLQKRFSGKILLNEKDISSEKIQARKIGIVFQDYALFPHLSVFENIAFSLRQKKNSKILITKQVVSICRDLEIEQLLNRNIKDLSGGEKQRVALARTLVMKPDILLLDEPLSALDVKLRWETRLLLRKLNKQGQTIIHVTHDYEEAMILATTVAIIENGELKQIGNPIDVFQNPKSSFIASLTGIKNYFRAEIIPPDDKYKTTRAVVNENITVCVNILANRSKGIVVISGNDIVLSCEKLQTSMINNYEGVVRDIIPTIRGAEVLVDIGIPLYANITIESIQKLSVEIGKIFWISFKASSVKFIPD